MKQQLRTEGQGHPDSQPSVNLPYHRCTLRRGPIGKTAIISALRNHTLHEATPGACLRSPIVGWNLFFSTSSNAFPSGDRAPRDDGHRCFVINGSEVRTRFSTPPDRRGVLAGFRVRPRLDWRLLIENSLTIPWFFLVSPKRGSLRWFIVAVRKRGAPAVTLVLDSPSSRPEPPKLLHRARF